MDYKITTNTHRYIKWFNSMKDGLRYCFKNYPEEDFEISTYIEEDNKQEEIPF